MSDKINFGVIREIPQKTGKWVQRTFVRKVLFGVAIIFAVLVVIVLVALPGIKTTYTHGVQAKALLEQAQQEAINRNFIESSELLIEVKKELLAAQEAFSSTPLIRFIPFVRSQVIAGDKLLIAGVHGAQAGADAMAVGEKLFDPLQNESITYATFGRDHKERIVNQLVAEKDTILTIQNNLTAATDAVADIDTRFLIPQLKESIVPVQQQIPQAQFFIDNLSPSLEVLPSLVGVDSPKRYLFLLQNNNELRPTGGFIGTYGVLELEDLEINSFVTDNIYNIDLPASDIIGEPAPEPIRTYVGQDYQGLRDINWNPDFPTTAQQAIAHYKKLMETNYRIAQGEIDEEGNELIQKEYWSDFIPPEVDGVMAVTPEPFVKLLSITGPIPVQGILFTEDNLIDEIEFRVGKEFKELGIDASNRKNILRQLAAQMQIRLLSIPYHQLLGVAEIGITALEEKAVQIYMKDKQLQDLITKRGWGGEMKSVSGDYLMSVDANLASLKTDPVIQRTITYSIEPDGDGFTGRVEITYTHTGYFTWKTTRYRVYNRIYVPQGSELVSYDGFLNNDKTQEGGGQPGEVSVSEENGKTVFGGFVSTEPGTESTIRYEYKLPRPVAESIKNGEYSLLIQKQAGVSPELTLDLKFGKTMRSAMPEDQDKHLFNREYNFGSVLNRDKDFSISL